MNCQDENQQNAEGRSKIATRNSLEYVLELMQATARQVALRYNGIEKIGQRSV